MGQPESTQPHVRKMVTAAGALLLGSQSIRRTITSGTEWNKIRWYHLEQNYNRASAKHHHRCWKANHRERQRYWQGQLHGAAQRCFCAGYSKGFRPTKEDNAVDPSRRPRARPELMRLPREGELRLWANLHGGEPGKCLDFVPEGLMVTNFEQDGSDVQNSVHCNRYKRTQVAENGFVVEQRMLVLEVPGYEKVDLTPCPDNEDINIDDGVLEVILRRKSPLPSDEWIEDGHGNDIHVVENKIQKYDMEMGWKETEITQNNGFLTILIHGKRKRLNRR